MMKTLIFILFLGLFINIYCEDETTSLSHGFLDEIDWVTWDDAVDLAKKDNKPIFLLIHKTWCGACQRKLIQLDLCQLL